MKRLHYMVLGLLLMLGAGPMIAQTDGLWLISRQRMSGTGGTMSQGIGIMSGGMTVQPAGAGGWSATGMHSSVEFGSRYAGTAAALRGTGSRYSSQITSVGASTVNPVNTSRPQRIGGQDSGGPDKPNQPGAAPVGDIPLLWLLLLSALYSVIGRCRVLLKFGKNRTVEKADRQV